MKDLDTNTVIILIKLFTDTLTDMFGKEVSDLVMKNVNDKVRTIRDKERMEKTCKPKDWA